MTSAEKVLQTHPWEGHVDRSALVQCIEACYECAQACTSCADACLSEEAVDGLRKCIRLNLDCADICEVTGRVVTRQTEYDAALTRRSSKPAVRPAPRVPMSASDTPAITSTAAFARRRAAAANRRAGSS